MDRTFDLYFASLVAMTLHPRWFMDDMERHRFQVEDCAEIALKMVELRRSLCRRGLLEEPQ